MKETMEPNVERNEMADESIRPSINSAFSASKPEDLYELRQKILAIEEDLEKRLQITSAAENTKNAYGGELSAFSTDVNGIESTPEFIEQEKKELQGLKDQVKEIRTMRKRKFLHSLKSFLSF